jgi:hypothetical protein
MSISACANPEAVWTGLDALVAAGRLFTVRIVFEELKRNDEDCYDRLHQHYGAIVVADTDLWSMVGDLAFRHQRMAKPHAARDKADAWVIVLAIERGLTVVCEERNQGARRERSMSYVCEREGIPCLDLEGLIESESLA